MLRGSSIAWVVLLLLFPFLACAQAVQRYTLEINGAGDLTPILTRHLDISQRQESKELSPEEVQRLIRIAPEQIRELLATEGYFSPRIRSDIDQSDTPWRVRFDVEPGPLAHVTTVGISFRGEIASGPHANQRRMDRLRQRWRLKPGEAFRQAAWNEAKNDLLKGLLNRDYPTASISESEARVDPETSTVALRIEVDSGPAFTFGELDIQGLSRYPRAMIDRLNPIHPGEPYSQEKLNELQARVQDTGYFRSVFATVDRDPAHAKNAPIRLDVAENPRRRLGLGLGFSTDTGARAQVRWLDRHFLGRDWRLESQLLVDRETRIIGGDVFLPPISIGWQPSVSAHFERTESAGEIDDKIRSGVRLTSPNRFDEKAWSIAFLADRQQIGAGYRNNRQALIGSFIYTKRRLDNPLMPRRGYLASVELGAGPRGFINESNIARVVGRGVYVRPLVKRWRTVLRGQVGQVFGGSRLTVPADLLFRTGGDQSVRGYGYNELGVAQDGAVVGGTVSAVVSGELIYQLTPRWGAAAFVDAGNATDSWKNFSFKRGVGVGARWSSPIGPVSIDLAHGQATGETRLHFSVGYGF